ncbi:hypothetical protein HWN74_27275, partial [Escherichia coli]|nr:hypothetical protein [Escherichia coli]
ILQSRADAQDLVQGLFVDILQKGETPDFPYLYRAITNRCLSFLRDERNRARILDRNDALLRGPVRTRWGRQDCFLRFCRFTAGFTLRFCLRLCN